MIKISYMCRTSRPSRAYKYPDQPEGDYIVLGAGLMFLSGERRSYSAVRYYKISSRVSTDVEFPVDYWVAEDVVDCTEIEEEVDEVEMPSADDSIAYDEYILITGAAATIYESKDSSSTITHRLSVGDIVHVTKQIRVSINGKDELRYLIEESSDPDTVGKWLLGDYTVDTHGYQIRYHSPIRVASAYTAKERTGDIPQSIKDKLDKVMSDDKTLGDKIGTDGRPIDKTGTESDVVTTGDTILENIDDSYGYTETDDAQTWLDEYELYDTRGLSLMDVPIGRMNFVHGMPFQYTYLTDRRQHASSDYGQDSLPADGSAVDRDNSPDLYGRVFAKEIAGNMPIAVIVPGVPVFMTNVSQGLKGYRSGRENRQNLLPIFDNLTDTEFASVIENALNDGDGETYQYYGMQVDTVEFFSYVNAQTQTAARLMGIADEVYCGQKCGNFDWAKYNRSVEQDFSMFEDIVGISNGVSVAFDPMSSITDTLSNDTSESQFAGMISGLKNTATELEFLTGMAGIGNVIDSTNYEAATAGLTNSGGLLAGAANAVSRLGALVKNTMHGMNVRFPKLWSDSSYSKSYSIDMRFITPYATAFCKWRYVLVPFLTLFSAAAPQSPDSIVNYKRPFLIRAFSKGYFNVEMGMINSINWKRFGDGDMISADGVPTQIDVSIDFEDLYQQLAISKFTGSTSTTVDGNAVAVFFNNTGLMDLIGTLSGVNMNRITLGERLQLYATSAIGAFAATGGNFMQHIQNRCANVVERYLYGS